MNTFEIIEFIHLHLTKKIEICRSGLKIIFASNCKIRFFKKFECEKMKKNPDKIDFYIWSFYYLKIYNEQKAALHRKALTFFQKEEFNTTKTWKYIQNSIICVFTVSDTNVARRLKWLSWRVNEQKLDK